MDLRSRSGEPRLERTEVKPLGPCATVKRIVFTGFGAKTPKPQRPVFYGRAAPSLATTLNVVSVRTPVARR